MEKVKDHVRKYKTFYVGVGVGLGVAGITWAIMRDRHLMIQRVVDPEIQRVTGELGKVQTRSFSFALFMRDSGNVTTSLHTGERGHPGFMTRCLETGEIFRTQYQAAKAFELHPSLISAHLNGKFPDVHGYHFERIFVD